MLIINKLFLNSIVTTNDILILKRKPTFEEERKFIMELFKINELFPSSISKQLILVDFYMEIYSFCIDNKFTIEHMSTIFSIFYFLFSYSFINSNIVVEKSLSLFTEILDFHAMNRPPFSHEIFCRNNAISFTTLASLPTIETTRSLRTFSSMKYRSVSSLRTLSQFPIVLFLLCMI